MPILTVGLHTSGQSAVLKIEAKDALAAALRAKHAHPEATFNYIRKSNSRGDRRHSHGDLNGKVLR